MFNWDGSVSDELDSDLARMMNDDKSYTVKPSSSSSNGSNDDVSLRDITFVNDYHLPIPGLLDPEDEDCYDDDDSVSDNNNKVNLPLVSSLLPSRYPQGIDPKTLCTKQRRGAQQNLVSNTQQRVFRSYDLMIDCETNTTSIAASQVGMDNGPQDVHQDKVATSARALEEVSSESASSPQQVAVVPVVQFTGTVGSGDRCIRSDQPFPPNCRRVSCCGCNRSSCHSSSCSSSGNSGGSGHRHHHQQQHGHSMSLGGLFSFTTTTSRRRRERRSRNSATRGSSRAVVSRNGSLSSTMSSHGGLNQSTLSPPVITHLPPIAGGHSTLLVPSQHSPLYRFISSLSSHHSTSPSSSVNDESTSQYGSTTESIGESLTSDERAIDESLNNYGMMMMMLPPSRSSKNTGLMSKCKKCFGKLRGHHYGSRANDNMRPFVIPNVISDTRGGENHHGEDDDDDEGGRGGLVIDVTPRLVAYFEVTIIKQQSGQETHDESSTLTNENNERPNRIVEAPARRAGHRQGRHQVLAPVHLPFPMMAAAMVAEAQQHPAGRQGNAVIQQQQRGQRHECVAIGLSTKAFSPHNRMPGWDDASYGYHSDDGGIFHGQGDMLRRYGPSFGPGDTVGCGLEYSTRRIFFVKNGVFLGYAFDKCKREDVEMGLYPTVGVDTECPIFVNYGRRPFKFDLRGFSSNGTEEGGM